MKTKNITLYVLKAHNYDGSRYIEKKTVEITKDDKVQNTKGIIAITLTDACQSGHNGDWYDEHVNGFETYKLAQKALIEYIKDQIKELKKRIDTVKNTKEPKDGVK